MSRVKPCLASKPRAFITFQTSGLNTGKVRLETLMTGLSWARTGKAAPAARAAAEAVKVRRVSMVIGVIPFWRARRARRHIGPRDAALCFLLACVGGFLSWLAAGL